MGDCDFLSDGIKNGFRIRDVTDQAFVLPVFCDYHPSAMKYADKVEIQFKNQLELVYYVKSDIKPKVVSALGAISKDDWDIRVIHIYI